MDLTDALIVEPPGASPLAVQARTVLAEEVGRRAQIVWPARQAAGPEILLEVAGSAVRTGRRWSTEEAESFRDPDFARRPEGFAVRREGEGLAIRGNDDRGLFYGVGWLLRHLEVRRSSVELPDRLLDGGPVEKAPRYPLRGHQIGYRPKTNSYCGWTRSEWDQYIRELAVFGANAVELIPPRSDDEEDSDHFPIPQMDMMAEMSAMADRYGLDVWIWYPALDEDYGDGATVQYALNEWRDVFERLPRIDALFVPGGDPGKTPPGHLFVLLEKQKVSLNAVHPQAQMWVSPQGFHGSEEVAFYGALEGGLNWLDGVVFGPWVHMTPAAFRERVPPRYPVRLYPDITHCWSCQYPVPEWDTALAACHGREPINPRPIDQARIFALSARHSIGALTYCEGNNDDANKAVWSALLWDPHADIADVMRQYGRLFLPASLADGYAAGVFGLERNWRGPLLSNSGVSSTLMRFQALERAAPPRALKSWRFTQALYRAYSDAYIRERLIAETAAETTALGELRRAPYIGALTACDRAEEILDSAAACSREGELRARVYALAEALFQSIHVQLSVPRYGAQAVRRGASLDGIEYPLNDRLWLKERFAEIRSVGGEAERIQAIETILRRTDPGPGGFYDNLGDPALQQHLVAGPGFHGDPSFLISALRGFAIPYPPEPIPYAWLSQMESIGRGPLTLRYEGLCPAAHYRLAVVYGGERRGGRKLARVRLDAITPDGGAVQVHDYIEKPDPRRRLRFAVPPQAVADGGLLLQVSHEVAGGPGRGAQVSEIWLERQDREALEAAPGERHA